MTPEQETTVKNETAHTTAPASPASWKQNMGIPAAIIIAGIIIAGAVYLDGAQKPSVNVQGGIDNAQNTQETAESVVAPVTEKDHIRGNPNAPIVIVEYSDYDCPFCKNFHETMNRIMSDYGKGGKVAWVYRHFPLEQLHPNAPKLAAASYCVAEHGGNDAFWKFSDLIFGERETNAQTNMLKLADYAVEAGVDRGKFELCQNSGKYDDQVKADVDAALKTGARGTPYSVIIVGDQQGVINGAQPYDTVKQIVDSLVSQINGA